MENITLMAFWSFCLSPICSQAVCKVFSAYSFIHAVGLQERWKYTDLLFVRLLLVQFFLKNSYSL